jgi:hypothetical protein
MATIYDTPYPDDFVLNTIISLSSSGDDYADTLERLQTEITGNPTELPRQFEGHLFRSIAILDVLRQSLRLEIELFAESHDKDYPEFAERIRQAKGVKIEIQSH